MTRRLVPLRWLALLAVAPLLLADMPPANAQSETLTTLATFNSTDGNAPDSDLTLIGNTLYGTTSYGGASNDGTIFSVPVGGGAPTTVATFTGTNGAQTEGSLTLIGSTFYGTTSAGGAFVSDGTVFALSLVPEPGTWLAVALGTGVLTVAQVRRRRRQEVYFGKTIPVL